MTTTAVKEIRASHLKEARYAGESTEMMVYCPGCKAFQTVWLNGETLTTTRKFIQVGNHIYHNCGSGLPCRLYIL
jgi:phage FluMu protein Com